MDTKKLTPEQLAEIRERLSAVIDLIGSDLQEPFSDTEALLEHTTALEAEKAELAERAKLWRESATEWQGDYLKVKQTINALLALPKNGLSIEAQELLSEQEHTA